ncbi:ribose-phosphate diphosphokinase [Candidatus Roizmanbacteria bacterium]|nr:ribose-phosphate diphosphokinase [Candidatus Roizmanbacteria bacterium]
MQPPEHRQPPTDAAETVFRRNGLEVLTGRANPELAKKVGTILNVTVDQPVSTFADGEIRIQIGPSLDRKDVFIVQPTSPPRVNDYAVELALMIDAARRASSAEITAIIPYFGYSRQDRKDRSRVPISSEVFAKWYEQRGAMRIVTVDIHSEQQQGFFNGPWDNLRASYTLVPALKDQGLAENVVVVSPDKGGVPRATEYARLLGTNELAVVYKHRDIHLHDQTNTLFMVGEVSNRNVVIVDDLISTFRTGTKAATLLKQNGAERIIFAATHGLFTEDALQRLDDSPIDEVWITDSIAHRTEVLQHPKIHSASIAPLLAESIHRIHKGIPLHDLIP